MPIPPSYLIAGLGWLALLAVADRLAGERRTAFRYVAAVATFALGLAALQRLEWGGNNLSHVAKGAIAAAALAAVLYERRRARVGRPIRPRAKRIFALTLSVAAAAAYFADARAAYGGQFFHVHEQYHYFLGAKYFRELGYDRLYRCAAVAQDELGRVAYVDAGTGRPATVDLRAEVRRPGRMIRDLGGTNALVPVAGMLASPEACRSRFSPARWEAFRADVRFFRLALGERAWETAQRDHGYNPPPVWTLAGSLIADLRPASVGWQRALALLDVGYLLAMFAALGWAFGWRVCAVAAVFWGTQAFSGYYWTGGGFLRQDWLFWMIFSVCLARKRRFALSGAALAYASLLRVFPALVAFGWLISGIAHLVRRGEIAPAHRRALVGGLAAVAVLVPLSMAVAGRDSYAAFHRHTIQLHGSTALDNNMGLSVALSHGWEPGPASGRLRYVPGDRWQATRPERTERTRPLFWIVAAVSLAWLARVLWRVRSLWIAQCLAQLAVAVLVPLTCYYYSFLLLTAPLTRARRWLEAPLFALAAASQAVWWAFPWNDEKYAALSVLALVFCYFVAASFARGRRLARERVHDGPLPVPGYAPATSAG